MSANAVRIQHSAYIPIGLNFLQDAALELVEPGQRTQVADVIRMVRSLFHYNALERRDRVGTSGSRETGFRTRQREKGRGKKRRVRGEYADADEL